MRSLCTNIYCAARRMERLMTRGASVLMTKARELGVAFVVEDSSGNAGGAFEAENTVIIPNTGSGTKSAQQILA